MNYEIHGYTVQMTPEQAEAWNCGDATPEKMKGAILFETVPVNTYTSWPMETLVSDTCCGHAQEIYAELSGYPANPIR